VEVSDTLLTDADDGSSFTVTVQFSEAMDTSVAPTLVFAADVVSGGTLAFGSEGWNEAGDTYTATYTAGDLDVVEADVTIAVEGALDAHGNAQQDYTPEVEFSVETLNPAVVSVTRKDPAVQQTNATSVTFEVVFSEDVVEFDPTDIALNWSGTYAEIIVTPGSGPAASYEVAVTGLSGNGTLGLLRAPGLDATDEAGNPLSDDEPDPYQSYVIDQAAPSSTITFPADDGWYSASGWTDTITGTASDSGAAGVAYVQVSVRQESSGLYWGGAAFDQADEDDGFMLATGTAAWTLPFSNNNFPEDGSYTVHARAVDAVGNIEASPTATFIYDSTAPVLTLVTPASGSVTNSLPTFSGMGGTLDGDSTTIVVNIYSGPAVAGAPVQVLVATRNPDGSYSISANPALTGGQYTARARQSDLAGNTGFSAPRTFTVDAVLPTVTNVIPSVTPISDGAVPGPFTLTVTFSEAMDPASTPVLTFPASGKDPTAAPASLTFTGGAWSTTTFADDTYTASYAVADQNVDMTGITVRVAGAADVAGNVQNQADFANNFAVDTLNPVVTGLTAAPAWVVDGVSTFLVTIVYSEPMLETPTPTIEFSPDATGTLTFLEDAWSGGGTTYTATYAVTDVDVSLGAITVAVTGGKDAAGNEQVPYSQSDAFSIDTLNNPSVSSILRANPSPTNAASVAFTVTFSRPVTGVDTGDLTLFK
ncbi:MAG TPA: Ig-like domain-containing protein, partial [Candidatus Anammoximicrobium sp.]|nr:Ig-like domain-containing protein [Candidatus Anammoximicrobium sp.]